MKERADEEKEEKKKKKEKEKSGVRWSDCLTGWLADDSETR